MTTNRGLAIALGIAALCGAAVVQADELKLARVPFAFEALGQRWEAGTYSAVDLNGGTLRIRNEATGQAAYLLPIPAGLTNSGESNMTFRCYGSDCFLNQIQFGGSQRIYQVRPTTREKELAKVEHSQYAVIATR